MAIVIILIGTILLIGVLIGGLALTLSFEEEPDRRENEAATLQPIPGELPAPIVEEVPENDVVIEPITYPQPPVSEPTAMQAEETLKSV
ncbi:hypothetical protein DXT99_19440 [Pontibacter diazotrophicus]|uniref:Uncharacterized protein n=1 Tax=Pontibacter diazotrophicus TaxID=1400979 RepID=A0A3D8L950_9BACT|nr:hypothetical protein [Pontibacter diazotrophicus]RDV13522.1 hypothetical protein DXT99_19440 [Pontibacter diazotrophicus]